MLVNFCCCKIILYGSLNVKLNMKKVHSECIQLEIFWKLNGTNCV